MSKALPFTDRELSRAWRRLRNTAHTQPRDNTHRLLLFYAIECGLKAVWLKEKRKTLFDGAAIGNFGHDLNKIIKELKLGYELQLLPDSVEVNAGQISRTGKLNAIHQVWRYGGVLKVPTDEELETRLERMAQWITKELA
ncbi:MAG: hypothetical protein RLZZ352_2318 [Pseudomonadota bacterium]|jgi:hypothetical protein